MTKRKKSFPHFGVDLQPIEWALINFYAYQQNQNDYEIVQRMILTYANADKRFLPKRFIQFVRSELGNNIHDRQTKDLLLRQTVRYARERHLADEPTLSQNVIPPIRR